ncbi:MBL fold metallo-hydrolase [Paenibacillus sacheonensis]|uniref:MBL fold metallo-hydrolase n=1 Tax=Paenibacillus sacheonensis TaxID=742054 RepID=A0A7X5C1Z5_9BACL|nr:MBL fold metallo-hydrolase [Paenibacillus sacheonensis]MBM7567837.1 L-ascorbate metabolism protein UlaG (beta-lactamase superfamily) [Paenibacillus sacheonensis]NBC70725.1 MBL fold metallo-hydrolase [Paenibacillus sacheonensis]
MQIKWFGHSSFLLTSDAGTRILIDPYYKFLGYRMPVPVESDIVVVTHNHGDHNKVKAASGDYLLVNEPKAYGRGDVRIDGFKTFHDKVNGKKRGPNIIFRFQIDGLTVCHCGDLGHLLTAEQAEAIGRTDVLIVPVGGRMTLDGAEAAQVMRQLQATVAIPMHYRTKALGLLGKIVFAKADPFLTAAGTRTTPDVPLLNVSKDSLSQYAGVVTMRYN